jgi:hypothetical protein
VPAGAALPDADGADDTDEVDVGVVEVETELGASDEAALLEELSELRLAQYPACQHVLLLEYLPEHPSPVRVANWQY